MGDSRFSGDSRGWGPRKGRRATVLVVAASLALACAPKQVIPLEVSPDAVTVFLNGEALAGAPVELELRSDRDHKLFFKREGYRPEMVVLRRAGSEDQPRLEPAEVRVRLAPLTGRAQKDLVVELED